MGCALSCTSVEDDHNQCNNHQHANQPPAKYHAEAPTGTESEVLQRWSKTYQSPRFIRFLSPFYRGMAESKSSLCLASFVSNCEQIRQPFSSTLVTICPPHDHYSVYTGIPAN
jgi:hypothetical protein